MLTVERYARRQAAAATVAAAVGDTGAGGAERTGAAGRAGAAGVGAAAGTAALALQGVVLRAAADENQDAEECRSHDDRTSEEGAGYFGYLRSER
jgi:hypothetical protein